MVVDYYLTDCDMRYAQTVNIVHTLFIIHLLSYSWCCRTSSIKSIMYRGSAEYVVIIATGRLTVWQGVETASFLFDIRVIHKARHTTF